MMFKYQILFMGNAGVTHLEINCQQMSDEHARQYVIRSLPYYHPVYYNASIYNITDEKKVTMVGNFKSGVVVQEVQAR